MTSAHEDALLLRHLAAREGFEFFVDFDGLHFPQRRVGQRPVRRLKWDHAPEVGELLSLPPRCHASFPKRSAGGYRLCGCLTTPCTVRGWRTSGPPGLIGGEEEEHGSEQRAES